MPFLIHGAAMILDEARFHHRRGLPLWERLGHPLDTLSVLACYALILALPPTRAGLIAYLGAAAFSCLFVIKDEWIHAGRCTGGEMWLHGFLFVMHPVLLGIAGVWRFAAPVAAKAAQTAHTAHGHFGAFLFWQTLLTAAFMAYQLLYWNGPWKPALPPPGPISPR
jgi:hypothetical protein